jgi:hypothetical protein
LPPASAFLKDCDTDDKERNQDHRLLNAIARCSCEFRPTLLFDCAASNDRPRIEEERAVVCRDREEPGADDGLPDALLRQAYLDRPGS